MQQLPLDTAHERVPDVVVPLSTKSDWVHRDFALFTVRSWFRRGHDESRRLYTCLGRHGVSRSSRIAPVVNREDLRRYATRSYLDTAVMGGSCIA